MGSTEDILKVRINPELGYVVLGRNAAPFLSSPLIAPIALWHKGNHSDPQQAAFTTLRQLRALRRDNQTFAIAMVAMPPEDEWR